MRRLTVATTIMLALLTVTGCSASGVVAFDREQTEADAPDIDWEALGIERDSARFLAEEEGVQYLVARGASSPLCLVHVTPTEPDSEVAVCGEHGLTVQWGSGPKVELVVPDMGERPGWRKLAPNLYAEED